MNKSLSYHEPPTYWYCNVTWYATLYVFRINIDRRKEREPIVQQSILKTHRYQLNIASAWLYRDLNRRYFYKQMAKIEFQPRVLISTRMEIKYDRKNECSITFVGEAVGYPGTWCKLKTCYAAYNCKYSQFYVILLSLRSKENRTENRNSDFETPSKIEWWKFQGCWNNVHGVSQTNEKYLHLIDVTHSNLFAAVSSPTWNAHRMRVQPTRWKFRRGSLSSQFQNLPRSTSRRRLRTKFGSKIGGWKMDDSSGYSSWANEWKATTLWKSSEVAVRYILSVHDSCNCWASSGVIVARGCRCRCRGTADFSSIFWCVEEKSDSGRRDSNPVVVFGLSSAATRLFLFLIFVY